MSREATHYETCAELAGLVARLANLTGHPQTASDALDLEHHFRKAAGLYEASENDDPFDPEAA